MINRKNQSKESYKGLTVLFVDDDREFINSLKRGLIDEEFIKIYASNGIEALDIIKKKEVNVIVADIKMPEMDGLTLLRMVKEHSTDIIRMALTAVTNPIEILKSINSGEVFRYVVKPIKSFNDFLSFIYEALDYYNLRIIEKKLIEAEERFRAIFESTADCISIFNKKYNCLYANRSAINYFSTNSCELEGKHIRDFLKKFPKIQNLWIKRIDQVIKTGKILSHKDILSHNDMIIHSESEFSPINDSEGNVVAIGIVYRDVTEIKKLQEELINSEKLIAASKMAAGFANEVGNRLASVSTSAQLCLSYLKPSVEIRKHLKLIDRNLNIAGEILHKLINFTNPELPNITKINLNDVMSYALTSLNKELQKKCIKAKKDLDTNIPPLSADEAQINELIENLLLNAIDASEYKGKLKIFTCFDCKNELVKGGIVDEGNGIPDDAIDKIFDPFFTTKECAAGLGLTVCNQIIKEHNGILKAKNNPNKGCTFEFHIPIK